MLKLSILAGRHSSETVSSETFDHFLKQFLLKHSHFFQNIQTSFKPAGLSMVGGSMVQPSKYCTSLSLPHVTVVPVI
jgi:hypothetical protein